MDAPLSRPLAALPPLLFVCFAACSPGAEPEPDPPEPPNAERCEALKTQQACFEAGCAFFANAAPLLDDEATGCARGPSFGVCLHAARPDEGAPLLTSYMRTLDDGTRHTLQLNQDAELEGWTRCGYTTAPPDCDCDGQ